MSLLSSADVACQYGLRLSDIVARVSLSFFLNCGLCLVLFFRTVRSLSPDGVDVA